MKPLPSALTGERLSSFVNTTADQRPALIEGFIHEQTVTMASGDPGVGKSTVTACWMAQASVGLPVFGQLFVPRPLVIYYLPFERSAQEIGERLKQIQTTIPINYDNLYVNDHFVGLNVNNDAHASLILGAIQHDLAGRQLDILVMDPIYCAVAGGLSTDEKASQFTRFSARLMIELKCANYLNHHTTKPSYASNTGQVIEKDDPFYGSVWLKAHSNGGFYLKKRTDGDGVTFVKKKDTYSCLRKEIVLDYQPETYTVYMASEVDGLSVKERLLNAYRKLRIARNMVTFRELQGCVVGVSDGYLRELLRTPPYSSAFKRHNFTDKPTLYEAIDDL